MSAETDDPQPWVHQGFRSENQYEPPYPFYSIGSSGRWAPRFDYRERTTMSLDAYTCSTCEHTQQQHWTPERRDNNRSYCTVCDCNHFVMKRVAEPDLPTTEGQ